MNKTADEIKLDEILIEAGYDPAQLEIKGAAIGRLGIKLLQEQQNHTYTRIAWDKTSQERDELKKRLKEQPDFLTVLEENFAAAKILTEEDKVRPAQELLIETYEDLILIYKSRLAASQSPAGSVKEAMKVLTEALRADKSEGSYYYSWQANIAMAFVDEWSKHDVEGYYKKDHLHNVSNEAAKRFLDLLTYQSQPETPSPTSELTIEDYKEAIEDNKRLVRELDVIINGENAAKQASLCDIVAQLSKRKDTSGEQEPETVSMDEYNNAINQIGQLQEQLKEAEQELRELHRGFSSR